MAVVGPYNTAALQAGIAADPAYSPGSVARKFEVVVDHSKAANQMAVNDTMPILKIPAGVHVIGAEVETVVAEGAAATVDLGITGGDVDRYIDGATVNAVGIVSAGDAVTDEPIAMANNGARIAAEELVSVLCLGAAIDNATVIYRVFAIDLRPGLNSDQSI